MNRIVLIGLLVASSAFAANPKPTKQTSEEYFQMVKAKMIAEGQDRIANSLNDPESGRFRNVFVSPRGRAVCGEVNAKNRMGGYVGFRRFISANDKAGVEDDGTYFAESNWQARCVKDELEGDPPKQ